MPYVLGTSDLVLSRVTDPNHRDVIRVTFASGSITYFSKSSYSLRSFKNALVV
jgi:hypothetical protein